MITEEDKIIWFWNIIAKSGLRREKLKDILMKLDRKDILVFQTLFVDFSVELQDEPYIDNMEESEDGIEDIANWIVSNGKEYYNKILSNPDLVPYSVEDRLNEVLYGVADEVFVERFGESTGVY